MGSHISSQLLQFCCYFTSFFLSLSFEGKLVNDEWSVGKTQEVNFCGPLERRAQLPVNLKVGIVQRDQPVGGSPSIACWGPFQHVNGIPVSDQHTFTSEVRFYLHQLIYLQQLKEMSI